MLTNTGRKKYVRDRRSPRPSSEIASRVMSANKAANTGPELLLRKELWRQNKRGYRLHVRVGSTRPDIVYPKHKIAIFVNGCYWHHCPYCKLPIPKSNSKFWREKFEKNRERDKKKQNELKKLCWKTYTLWECHLKKDKTRQANRILIQ